MAKKKKNEHVILENIELKPQVIGYTYQKKSNLGRVIFIFIAFLLVVYYINDISVFINKLIGKDSAETIEGLSGSNNDNNVGGNNNTEKNELIYNIYDVNLVITEGDMRLNNFNYIDGKLTFDVNNTSNKQLNLSEKKYFIETYSENKTLLERVKLDVNTINESSKVSFELDITKPFYYLVLEEKTIEDYPAISLTPDENGVAILRCLKATEEILYTFRNDELETIKHTISDSNVTDANYYNRYTSYQSKAATYNTISGMSATFNGTLNGYTLVVAIDLANANLSTIDENYYYGYKEIPEVVKFEMQTYGFGCN